MLCRTSQETLEYFHWFVEQQKVLFLGWNKLKLHNYHTNSQHFDPILPLAGNLCSPYVKLISLAVLIFLSSFFFNGFC